MDRETFIAAVEELQQAKKYYLLDIFPEQVPDENVRYFAVERFLMKGKTLQRYAERVGIIVLKLLCFEEADIYLVGTETDSWYEPFEGINLSDITVEQLATVMKAVITRDSGALMVLFKNSGALISIEGGFQTTVYCSDHAMLRRIALLGQAEGIFFRPGGEG